MAARLLLLLLLLLAPSARSQQLPLIGVGVGTCSQAPVFIARTSGENGAALTQFICGLVAAGMIDPSASMASTGANTYCGSGSVFDRLFIHAMNNSTDAVLDVCGHSSATANGSPTFTSNAGYTGSNANNATYLDTLFNPSSGSPQFQQNSSHFSTWLLTNVSSTGLLGFSISTITAQIYPEYTDGNLYCGVTTSVNGGRVTTAVANTIGQFICTRTAATTMNAYKGGSSIGSSTGASAIAENGDIWLLASNTSGTGGVAGVFAMGSMGGGISSAQASNYYSLGCAYLTAVHGSC